MAGPQSVQTLTIGVSGSGKGTLYIDDIRLYRVAPPVVQPVDPGTAGLSAYYSMEGDVQDSSGHGYHGTAMNDPLYVDGRPDSARPYSLMGWMTMWICRSAR